MAWIMSDVNPTVRDGTWIELIAVLGDNGSRAATSAIFLGGFHRSVGCRAPRLTIKSCAGFGDMDCMGVG
jgi:hypothetical protein